MAEWHKEVEAITPQRFSGLLLPSLRRRLPSRHQARELTVLPEVLFLETSLRHPAVCTDDEALGTVGLKANGKVNGTQKPGTFH
jgi:hypothetical protein